MPGGRYLWQCSASSSSPPEAGVLALQGVLSIKKLISTTPVLRYYVPNKELVIQWDASQKGFGAALMQSDKPIAYACQALTETETRYIQIEKEALSIVFALGKFHQYTFGRKIVIESDHKPLEMISFGLLCRAQKRLTRYANENFAA